MREQDVICPIAGALELFGDRWSLVLARDLLVGKRRFTEFLDSPEGIKRNILAERLRRFETAGLVERRPYQHNPPRFDYVLTAAGADLVPILQAVARWGEKHVRNVRKPPPFFYEATPRRALMDAARVSAPPPAAKRD